MSVDHYENFPVASFLLPKPLRRAVAAIYWFARRADDIADEGDAAPAQRLAGLDAYRTELLGIAAGEASDEPLFAELAQAIAVHGLPMQPFHDLLDAFSQDVVKQRYASFAELLDYCRRSANPVGALLLHLYRAASAENLRRSDAICTSLQLINFWQDIAVDWRKGRVYLPQDELARFAVSEAQIAEGRWNASWAAMMDFQVDRARAMMLEGSHLVRALPGRIGFELRLIVLGGLRILEKLQRIRGNVFRERPVLTRADWPLLAGRGVLSYLP
jgi:phytoene synthase